MADPIQACLVAPPPPPPSHPQPPPARPHADTLTIITHQAAAATARPLLSGARSPTPTCA